MKTRGQKLLGVVGRVTPCAPVFTDSHHEKTARRGLTRPTGIILLLLCFSLQPSAFSLRALGQSYSIDWFKVSGGGTSTGGRMIGTNYSVSGTIGQPDASSAMTGGSYSLTGGFWSLYSVIQTEGAPLLGIMRSNSYAILSWPSPSTGYGLELTSSLSGPSWNSVTNTPADNGTIKSVTLPVQPGNKFFRLKQQ